jgi:NAD(P)-dependent dehydrogenase (short-subunit alcohol dehydrogenase family)
MTQSLNGRVALVTGGARGLGQAIVSALAGQGAAIAVLDLDQAGLDITAKLVRDGGSRCCPLLLDLAQRGSAREAVLRVVKELGRLDILVNNAGTASVQPLLEASEEEWDKVFAVNVRGLFSMLQAAATYMKDHGGGRIINITSPASKMALPNYTAYSASKAAVDSITRAAAVALGKYGITVNGVAPGRINTEMQRMTEEKFAALAGMKIGDFIESRTKDIPLQRRVAPEEVAQAVLWLASDAAAYVTGDRLNISGGLELS